MSRSFYFLQIQLCLRLWVRHELQEDFEALTVWSFNLEALKALKGMKRALAHMPLLISSWDGDLDYSSILLGWEYNKTKFGNHLCLFRMILFVFIITLFNLTVFFQCSWEISFLQYIGMVSLKLSLDSQECMFFVILPASPWYL